MAAEPAGDPFAVKIPQRQAVGLDVEVWVEAHLVGQRVGVRDKVARRAVGLDELLDASNLVDLEVDVNLVVDGPADRPARMGCATARIRRPRTRLRATGFRFRAGIRRMPHPG